MPDEHELPAIDDPARAYERWRIVHPSMEAQAPVAAFIVDLVRSRPPPGPGERVIISREAEEPLEVRIAWMFDAGFGGGRGLLRLLVVSSPGDPSP